MVRVDTLRLIPRTLTPLEESRRDSVLLFPYKTEVKGN